jgi:hypothetical protein
MVVQSDLRATLRSNLKLGFTARQSTNRADIGASRTAFRFVLLIGILRFFADFTYEGSRRILGPFLASLQASGTVVGVITGFGELLGYGLRLVSGRLADATGRFWPITIFGYVVQMAAVPALALVDSWPAAAILIILERAGKAIRNPPRDVMLSHAGKQPGGQGWVFGFHEALDQCGAMFGPLVVAAVLARHGSYHSAFAVLLVPALINLVFVLVRGCSIPAPGPRNGASERAGQRAAANLLDLLGGRCACGCRLRRLSHHRLSFRPDRRGARRMDRDLLRRRYGCQRQRVTFVRALVRPVRVLHPDRPETALGPWVRPILQAPEG